MKKTIDLTIYIFTATVISYFGINIIFALLAFVGWDITILTKMLFVSLRAAIISGIIIGIVIFLDTEKQ